MSFTQVGPGRYREDRPPPGCPYQTAARFVTGAPLLIMVLDDVPERAANLKSLIEFMDAPQVEVAAPESWLSGLGDRRLAAVFLRGDLGRERLDQVMEDVGEHDPNVPIVIVSDVATRTLHESPR